MTEELDAVLFDAGGTLWDVRPSREEQFVRALRARGLETDPADLAEALRKADRVFDDEFALQDGVNEAPFWERYDGFVLREAGVHADPKTISSDISAAFKEIVNKLDTWTAFPDAAPALRELKERGFVLGLVSNATDLARRVLKNLDMERYFDFVVLSAEVGVRKPRREIFDIALRNARAAPRRTLFVGDKLAVDVKGALGAGMNAILIDRMNVYPDAHVIRIRDLHALRRFL